MRTIQRCVALAVMLGACGGGGDGDDEPAVPDAAPDVDAAAPVDAGVDAALALCARSGMLFCEDFEALAPGPATSAAWTTESANGTLTIDGEHARGAHALKVATIANGRGRLVLNGLVLPGNSAFGSMHVWVSAFPTAPDYAHFTLMELSGTGSSTLVRPVGGQYAPGNPAGAFWGVGSDGGPTGDWENWKRTAPADGGRWVCVEFQLGGTDSSVKVWLDGTEHPELAVSRTTHGGNAVDFEFPTINRAWFGWWLYQANPAPGTYNVWLDDLALAPTRIGCD